MMCKKFNSFSISSNLNWDELPLTYNQASSNFTFDIYSKQFNDFSVRNHIKMGVFFI